MFDRLDQAIDAAQKEVENSAIVLEDDLWGPFGSGLKYGECRRGSYKIVTLKGKPTRKYFHVIITRMDTGRYELVCYAS